MIKKILLVATFIMVCSIGSLSGARAEENTKLFLKTLIKEALSKNPLLLTTKNQIKARKERIPQAGTLPDPILKLGLVNLPEAFDFNDDPMTQKQISLSQKIPFPGKLGLREKLAQKDFNRFEAEFAYQQLEIINKVKNAYYSLFFIEKSIEITEKNKTLLKNFLEIAQSLYSVGKGVQQDVLKAEVELSRMREKLVVLKQQKITITARLNTLIDRDPYTPLEGRPEVSLTLFTPDPKEVKNSSLDDHPMLKSVQCIREKAETAYHLARKEYYPNFEVGFSYAQREDSMHRNLSDLYSGFLGINIPIWYKTRQNRKVEEMRYTFISEKSRYEAIKNDLQFKIVSLLAEIDQNGHLIDLYHNEIIPQATHTLDSSLASYQVGEVDFLAPLINLLTLYTYELEYYKAFTNYEKNLADLELAVGKKLF